MPKSDKPCLMTDSNVTVIKEEKKDGQIVVTLEHSGLTQTWETAMAALKDLQAKHSMPNRKYEARLELAVMILGLISTACLLVIFNFFYTLIS